MAQKEKIDPRVKYHRKNINPNPKPLSPKSSGAKLNEAHIPTARVEISRDPLSRVLKICAKSGGLSDLWCEQGFQHHAYAVRQLLLDLSPIPKAHSYKGDRTLHARTAHAYTHTMRRLYSDER
jgi:hypothetical protein